MVYILLFLLHISPSSFLRGLGSTLIPFFRGTFPVPLFFFSLIIFLALFSSPINDQQLCQEDSHDRMGDEQNQTRSEVGQSIKLMKKATVVDLSHLALSIALLL